MPDKPAGTLPDTEDIPSGMLLSRPTSVLVEGAAMPKVLRSLTAHLRADQACHWVRRDETCAVRVVEHCQAAKFESFSKLDRTPAGKSDEPTGVIEICTVDNILLIPITLFRGSNDAIKIFTDRI